MVEFDVGLPEGGPAMYRHRTLNKQLAAVGPVSQKQIRYAVRHDDGETIYELRIPVEQVGLKPLESGQVLRASLLMNANDGEGRRSSEWFGGIREAKNPDLFGHLILKA